MDDETKIQDQQAPPSAIATGLCAFCSKPAEGNYSIHRDGLGRGPEVPLCDEDGAYPEPTVEEIWERIRERCEDGIAIGGTRTLEAAQ